MFLHRYVLLPAVALAAVIALPTPARAQKDDARADLLALVPADAFAFVHFRIADLRKNDWFALLPRDAQRAFSDDNFLYPGFPGKIEELVHVVHSPLQAFDGGRERVGENPRKPTQVVPAPSEEKGKCGDMKDDEDRPEDEKGDGLVLLRLEKKLDLTKLEGKVSKEKTLPGASLVDLGFGPFLVLADGRTLAHAFDVATLRRFARARKGHAALAQIPVKDYIAVLGIASGPKHVAALRAALAKGPGPEAGFFLVRGLIPPLAGLEAGAATLTLGDRPELRWRGRYVDAAAAKNGVWAIEDVLALLRLVAIPTLDLDMEFEGRRAITPDQELSLARVSVVLGEVSLGLRHAKVTCEGALVSAQASLGLDREALKTRAAALVKARADDPGATAKRLRAATTDSLRQIAIAMHHFHADHRGLPPQAILDKKTGKPLLSWRVAILPYIEQGALYKRFKLDEPWDSPHNIKLLEAMPEIYLSHAAPTKVKGGTFFQVFSGKHTIFELQPDRDAMFGARGLGIAAIRDGSSNTLLVVEGASAVPWTKPEDIPFDSSGKTGVPKLGGVSKEGFVGAYGDGVVEFHRFPITERYLFGLIHGGDGMGRDSK